MSMKLMVKAFDIDFGSPIKKLIMLKLADNADDNGKCFPSMKHIAEKCNCSRSTVVRNINLLEKGGFLSIERRYKNNSKENQSNTYTIKLGGSTPLLGSSTKALGGSSTKLQESTTSINQSLKDIYSHFPESTILLFNEYLEIRKKIKAPVTD